MGKNSLLLCCGRWSFSCCCCCRCSVCLFAFFAGQRWKLPVFVYSNICIWRLYMIAGRILTNKTNYLHLSPISLPPSLAPSLYTTTLQNNFLFAKTCTRCYIHSENIINTFSTTASKQIRTKFIPLHLTVVCLHISHGICIAYCFVAINVVQILSFDRT